MPKTLTPQKKKAIDDAMNWLRNNDPNRPTWTIRQPGAGELAGLPCPAVCLRRRRPEVVEDSVNWLRNNELKPEISPSYGSDEPRGTPMPKGTLTPQRRRPLTTR
jgi:hypothetical protein